jgi:hypothetical protein
MKVKNISYPHPVLGNNDDVSGSLKSKFSHVLGREKVSLRTEFELENNTLKNMIAEKKAVFSIEVECNSTFYRNSFTTPKYKSEFSIDARRLREYVTIKLFVRASERIENYEIEGSHSDYGDFKFDIDKGDILAFGGMMSFIAEKEFDPLRPAVSSFMAVREGREPSGPIAVDYEDPAKIYVILSKKDWENYQHLKDRQGVASLLHSFVVFPVLVDAIRMIEKEDDAVENTYWAKRIETIITQKNLSLDSPIDTAQRMLDSPVDRSFYSLENFLDNE